MSNLGRNVISVGMGNEGNAALHTSGQLVEGEPYEISFNVDTYEVSLNVQLWKQYVDAVSYTHLDVYKRQIMNSTMKGQSISAIF